MNDPLYQDASLSDKLEFYIEITIKRRLTVPFVAYCALILVPVSYHSDAQL